MRHLLALWLVVATQGCVAQTPTGPAEREPMITDSVRVDLDSTRAEVVRSTHYRISVPVAQFVDDSPVHFRANATLRRRTLSFGKSEFPAYIPPGRHPTGRTQIFRRATVKGALTHEWSTPELYSGLLGLWMLAEGVDGDDGQTHQWNRLRSVTLDVESDTLVELSDVFEPDSPWLARLGETALPALRRQILAFGQETAKHAFDVGPYDSSQDGLLKALSHESIRAAAFTLGPDSLMLHLDRTAVTDWAGFEYEGPPAVFSVAVAYSDLEAVLRRDGLVARIRSSR